MLSKFVQAVVIVALITVAAFQLGFQIPLTLWQKRRRLLGKSNLVVSLGIVPLGLLFIALEKALTPFILIPISLGILGLMGDKALVLSYPALSPPNWPSVVLFYCLQETLNAVRLFIIPFIVPAIWLFMPRQSYQHGLWFLVEDDGKTATKIYLRTLIMVCVVRVLYKCIMLDRLREKREMRAFVADRLMDDERWYTEIEIVAFLRSLCPKDKETFFKRPIVTESGRTVEATPGDVNTPNNPNAPGEPSSYEHAVAKTQLALLRSWGFTGIQAAKKITQAQFKALIGCLPIDTLCWQGRVCDPMIPNDPITGQTYEHTSLILSLSRKTWCPNSKTYLSGTSFASDQLVYFQLRALGVMRLENSL